MEKAREFLQYSRPFPACHCSPKSLVPDEVSRRLLGLYSIGKDLRNQEFNAFSAATFPTLRE